MPGTQLIETKERIDSAAAARKQANEESELPYSFSYKIKQKFIGLRCPICGVIMKTGENGSKDHIPSIQHNIPISKGGRHELGNISIICKFCNLSQNDKPTDDLNADEVASIWLDMIGLSNARPIPAQYSIGKVSLGQDRNTSLSSGNSDDRQELDAIVKNETKKPKDNIPYQEILNKFAEILSDYIPCPKFVKPGSKRQKAIKARWSYELPTLDDWIRFFQKIERSDFLTGRNANKDGNVFRCSFDWMICESNCTKIIDNNYCNRG
jgi:hypothetical protein